MSDLSPREAADEVERVMARTMPLRNQAHLRVLIDHARATSAPEHAALADGTVLRDQTARELGIAAQYPSLRAVPDDLLARLACGCDPNQGHHTCQRRR